ncbi:MAG: hypothetical protein SGPRY_003385 [Prymnesium sp.]
MLEAALGCFAAVVAVAAAARASRRASRPLCSDLPSLTLVKPPTHNRRPPSQLDDLVLGETRACPEWERLLSLRCFSLHLLRHGNALFLQTPEGVDVYSSFSGSFVKDAQLRNAVSVLSVPMEMMMRWAEGLGVACDSLLLTSTGRCGSTLLAQLLESQPGVISISEPMALGVSAAMLASPRAVRSPDFLGEWIKQEATSVAAAALAAQLKDFKRGQLVCIKLHSQGTVVAPLLAKAFPEMRQLYLYRNAEETVTSFNRFAMALLPGFIVRLKASFVGRLVFYKGILPLHLTYKTMPFFISNLMDEEVSWARSVWVWAQVCRVRALAGVFTLARQKDAMSIVVSCLQDWHLQSVLTWASNIRTVQRFLQRGEVPGLVTLHYDDLVTKREAACARLLSFCKLAVGASQVQAALAVMDVDSQQNSRVGKMATGDQAAVYTDAQRKLYDEYLKRFGVPCKFGGELRLPANLLES